MRDQRYLPRIAELALAVEECCHVAYRRPNVSGCQRRTPDVGEVAEHERPLHGLLDVDDSVGGVGVAARAPRRPDPAFRRCRRVGLRRALARALERSFPDLAVLPGHRGDNTIQRS
jgi:hypothetical protein